MKTQTLTQEQLDCRLKNTPETLYSAVRTILDFNFLTGNDPEDESFSEFLEMLDAETAEKIREASLQMDDHPDEPEIFLLENESTTFLDLVAEDHEGHKVILIEGDINLSGNLFIEEYVTLIVAGRITAKNIIVNGSLYSSGSLTCDVLFGASANDNETFTAGNIYASLIAENGQYTHSEGKIYSKYLISFHNEIEGRTGKFIENAIIETDSEAFRLHPEVLDKNGYFDESAFLQFINQHPVEALFR
ncbi:MAG: polymer-forming cytoskeletal protein [Chryseobacterium sp.]|jgi:hypothetical protein|uniref:polymer-forming cytoskeletal protein n=1 Tax=Chryseobacterium sp. TaxID=1871047 RepID=UPI00281F7C28|nr:polymer-forming cytoskeletal protein [Chryseobacterium sp.]MDR2235818.1 polymer-forming cytoskeletal protein [Chryseobacterium sp.]